MLADTDGELRWASATDQRSQLVKGPCPAAFAQRTAITVRNAGTEPDPDGSRSVLRNSGLQAALSVPVELHRGAGRRPGADIEQARGALMEREHLDAATAHERLRTVARSSNRKVADVARDLLAGAPFPPTQP